MQQLILENDKKTKIEKFYDSQIETYDIIDGFSYWESLYFEYSNWIKKNLTHSDYAIELGCGTGLLTKFLKQKSNAVYGFDLCRKFLKKAHCISGKDFHPNCAEITNLPLKNDFSDVVVCLNTLDHIRDLKSIFSEINRITKDDGIFLFDITSALTLDPWSFFGINGKKAMKDSFSKLNKNTILYDWQLKADDNKIQKILTFRHSPQFVERLLRFNGFEIINKRGVHFSNFFLPEKFQVNSSSSLVSKVNKFCLKIDDKLNSISCMKNYFTYVMYACRKI